MDNTRRVYLDNIRWITVCIVVIYHVIYMYNGVQMFGVIGPFKEQQLQDAFQYLVYPWMMALLYTVSGMTVRYYLEKHNLKECIRDKTRKLLVPSTIGLFVFQWILGYYNMKISGAFESFESVPGIVRYVVMAISGIGVLWYIQVFKSSIRANASAIIGFHNHPSGNVKPSKEDMIVTRKLQKCGQLLGIELLDHIIVGGTNGKMLSFREEKMLNVTGRMDWER